MRSYKTLDDLHYLAGAFRALDLLGQLPLREPALANNDPFHDVLALADDWSAVGEDLWAAHRAVLEDRATVEALENLHQRDAEKARRALGDIQLRFEELRKAAEALADSGAIGESTHDYHDETNDQMELFEHDLEKKAG